MSRGWEESAYIEAEAVWQDDVIEALKPHGFKYCGSNASLTGITLRNGNVTVTASGKAAWHYYDAADKYWQFGHRLDGPSGLLAALQQHGIIESSIGNENVNNQ